MLGMLEAEQRAVRRQSAAQEPAVVEAAEADPLGRAHELRGRRAIGRDVARRSRRDRRSQRRRPPEPGRDRHSSRAEHRRNGSVSPPSNGWTSQRPDSSPVSSWNQRTPSPSRVGTASVSPTGSSVTWRVEPRSRSERVDLPTPGLVRRVHGTSRSGRRPFGKVRDGRSEALLPPGRGHAGRGYPSRIAPCSSPGTGRCSRARTRRGSLRPRFAGSHPKASTSSSVRLRLARGDATRPRPGQRDARLRTERPLGARGRVHGRGVAVDAPRARRLGSDRRALRAAPAVRRDRRDRASPGGGCARGGTPRHRLRR